MGEPIATVGNLAGLCGYDDPDWVKIVADSNGYLQVDVVDSGGSDLNDIYLKLNQMFTAMLYRSTGVTIYNKTMANANTEYSQALPAYTKKITVKCRGEYDVKLAFEENDSGTTYITIPANQCYWDDLMRVESLTLYFQCATAGQVLEIVAWN